MCRKTVQRLAYDDILKAAVDISARLNLPQEDMGNPNWVYPFEHNYTGRLPGDSDKEEEPHIDRDVYAEYQEKSSEGDDEASQT